MRKSSFSRSPVRGALCLCEKEHKINAVEKEAQGRRHKGRTIILDAQEKSSPSTTKKQIFASKRRDFLKDTGSQFKIL